MSSSDHIESDNTQESTDRRKDWKHIDSRDRFAAIGKIVGCVLVGIICLALIVAALVVNISLLAKGAVSVVASVIVLAVFGLLIYNIEDWWQEI